MSKALLWIATPALVLVAACTGAQDRMETGAVPAEPGAGAPEELGATLNVGMYGDTARIELHVTNATADVITLEFATAQRYDVEISDAAGQRLWQWSDDMMFAQVLGREALRAGESLKYAAAWASAGPGDYIATARLVSTNYPVELRTSFRIPAD